MLKLRYMFFVLALAGTLFLSLGANASLAAPSGPNPVVIMETTMGRIIIMLYPKETPVTCMNFLRYVDEGFYDGTVFHRIVKMEVDRQYEKRKQQAINIVQGGGYVYPLRRKAPLWGPIPNEGAIGLKNLRGTVAMARGSAPDSAQCEFFFNVLNNPGLNPMVIKKKAWEIAAESDRDKSDVKTVRAGYCAFAKVIRGMDVVDKMLEVKTERRGRMQDVPVEPIFIKRMYRAK